MPSPVLVLAAHPDDETLGCGGTIRKLSDQGHPIMLITFTDGEGARISTNYIDTNHTNPPEDRNQLLPQVCQVLGISQWVSGTFPDNRMDSVDLLDLVKFIEDTLTQYQFKPQIIFTHHPDCLNIDHSLVYRATVTAFRPQKGRSIRIYSYFVPSSTDYNPLANFRGNVYFRLNDSQVAAKQEALRIYNQEMRRYPHTRSYRNLNHLNNVWGSEIGTKNAEKFQLIRQVF